MAAIRKGNFTIKSTAKDNLSGAEDTREETGQFDLPKREGDGVAVVKAMTNAKLSLNYQSIGVEVGIEVPWPVKAKSLKSDLEDGLDFVENVVDERIQERVEEVKKLLNKLSGR
jgi:hypothetical protein